MNQQAKELNSLIEQVSQRVVDRTINEKYLISRMAVIVNSFDEETNTASIIIPTDLNTPTQYKYPNRTGRRKLNYGDKVYLVYQTNNISQGWLEDNKGFTGGGGYGDFRFVKGRAITLYDTDGVTPIHRLLPENILFYDGTDASTDLFNYNRLDNKPQINGVELIGDKSTVDLLSYTPAAVGHGECTTNGSTAAKKVNVAPRFKLQIGSVVGVKFANTNTAENPTLNVSNTGAKSIYYNTGVITTNNLTAAGVANRIIYYMYNGTYWCFLSWGVDVDENTTYSAISENNIKSSASTTTGLITGQRFKQGFDNYFSSSFNNSFSSRFNTRFSNKIVTGSYVYSGASTDTITLTDANVSGKSFIICGTQDAGNPVLRASISGTTITAHLSGAVTLMRLNYICF